MNHVARASIPWDIDAHKSVATYLDAHPDHMNVVRSERYADVFPSPRIVQLVHDIIADHGHRNSFASIFIILRRLHESMHINNPSA